MSLFGAPATGGGSGLFGSSSNNAQKPSLFGSLNTTANATSQPQQSGGLFSGLGASTQQNQPQQTGGGLFGNLGQQNQQNQSQPSGGMFGASSQQNQNTGGSMFGASQQQQPSGNLFNSSTQQAQQHQTSLYGGSSSIWQNQSRSEYPQKPVLEQIESLFNKWNPGNKRDCTQKTFFYNEVPADIASYYVPDVSEDAAGWEEALAKRPSETSVPILAVGIVAVNERMTKQSEFVHAFQGRMHDINNSLSYMIKEHDLSLKTRAEEAKRRHHQLSLRCMALAGKVQVLRNRGYALGPAEEELKKKIAQLEKQTFDPILGGRAEEIWARLSGVRERANILYAEMKRVESKGDNAKEKHYDVKYMETVKQILQEFDQQLHHIEEEVKDVTKEFTEWKKSTQTQSLRN
ncbi:hypothetical protein K402DRAFT_247596 [Aulographum hederae CBS 113979]|uniref:Nucleoporin Nup54 alpha-helical domain-containing protein n=1 Tax=Aulographum hederae CBS 113979 TaxID=1176131 RepID=A0A6G1HAN3_9PEZI|nr:hypothetical protein K402DRAFT_247596 [Aulographum hederae CBS 113979]